MPVMLYLSYLIGTVVLKAPVEPFAFEASFAWLWYSMTTIGKPLLTGCFLMGLASSIAGYFAIDWLWRLSIRKEKLSRLLKRNKRQAD